MHSKTDAFLFVLMLHLAFRRAFDWIHAGASAWTILGLALFGAAAVLFGLRRRERSIAVIAAFAYAVADLGMQFPVADNHAFVETFCLALAAVCQGPSGGDARLLAGALRAVVALVFVHAGWQKAAHGAYFDGSYLVLMAKRHEGFRAVLETALGEPMRAALASIPEGGPYRADVPLLRVFSNALWITELVTGALLLVPRTRRAGLVLLVVTVAAIEWVARELVFGLLCLNLGLLYARARWSRRAVPAFALAYLLLLVSATGWLWELDFK